MADVIQAQAEVPLLGHDGNSEINRKDKGGVQGGDRRACPVIEGPADQGTVAGHGGWAPDQMTSDAVSLSPLTLIVILEFVGLQGRDRTIQLVPPVQTGQLDDADGSSQNTTTSCDKLRRRLQCAAGRQQVIT